VEPVEGTQVLELQGIFRTFLTGIPVFVDVIHRLWNGRSLITSCDVKHITAGEKTMLISHW
jgi:hypothetical protein